MGNVASTLFCARYEYLISHTPEEEISMNNRIVLSLHNEMYVIHCDKVLYMEADDHYTHIVYISGAKFMVPFGLSELEKRIGSVMSDAKFLIRFGRKYIINMRHVFHVNTVRQVVVLTDGNGNNISVSLPKNILRNIIEAISNPDG